MKPKITIILAVSLLAAGMAGCGASDTVYIEQTESVASDSTEDTGDTFGEVSNGASGEASAEDLGEVFRNNFTEASGVGNGVPDDIAGAGQDTQICYVYVCGAVREPGVYQLSQGSRVYEALLLAGGLTEDASERSINQAESVWDGQMIFVPTAEEEALGVRVDTMTATAGEETSDGRVNLNTASVSELMTLPGIGQIKAESIVAYREQNGAFSSVEEIMQVDGIKEGLYARIKNEIRVK